MINFDCWKCGQPQSAPPETAGRLILCSSCGTNCSVPSASLREPSPEPRKAEAGPTVLPPESSPVSRPQKSFMPESVGLPVQEIWNVEPAYPVAPTPSIAIPPPSVLVRPPANTAVASEPSLGDVLSVLGRYTQSKLKGERKNVVTPGLLCLALIMFFLPWLNVTCNGRSVAKQSGLQAASGGMSLAQNWRR